MPEPELDLIRSEAHLDRSQQTHREDLYLEIEAAESVLRSRLPELGEKYARDLIIRQFASKRETGNLTALTDFRYVGRLVKAADDEIVDRPTLLAAVERLITDETASPRAVYETVAAEGYRQKEMQRKAELLSDELEELVEDLPVSDHLREQLLRLRDSIDRILGAGA
jgi:hypothetical protein